MSIDIQIVPLRVLATMNDTQKQPESSPIGLFPRMIPVVKLIPTIRFYPGTGDTSQENDQPTAEEKEEPCQES